MDRPPQRDRNSLNTPKKLEIRELYCIDPNILAQLDDNGPWGRATWQQHVPVPLRGQGVRHSLSGGRLHGMDPRRAVHRLVVELVCQWHTEVRRGRRQWWGQRRL